MAFALPDQASEHHIGIESRIQSLRQIFLRRCEFFPEREKF